MMPFLVQYDEFVQIITEPKKVVRDPYCNGYVVKNIGNTILLINLDPLQPGEFRSMGGNLMEIYQGRIEIKFGAQVTDLADPPVTMGVCTQKYYAFKNKKAIPPIL